jgi:hypothetical protein
MLILNIIIAIYNNDFFMEIFENDLMNLLDKQDINFEQFFILNENDQVIFS